MPVGSSATPDDGEKTTGPVLTRGAGNIRRALANMPDAPGVYRMLNAKGHIIYVGKAKSLRKRVASYAQSGGHTRRIQRMISETVQVEITTTHTEAEALLLESNLIKQLKPNYNILLRDDKSFPYIMLTADHAWPRIQKHRGARNRPGDYYGPFAAAGAVNETLAVIERAFLLRTCSDSVFESRTRPCLLYQIKRCSAPCVGRIARAGYDRLVAEARSFLEGRDQDIADSLAERMQAASARQDYELAATYRDRIRALSKVRSRQGVNIPALRDSDVIGAYQDGGQTCIQVFFFRAGRNYGNRAYFPRHDRAAELPDVLSAFVGQFYAARPAPKNVVLSHGLNNAPLIEEALASRSGHRVRLTTPHRGDKREAVKNAIENAREALARKVSESQANTELLEQVALRFGLDTPPRRIEVYDNSHIQGRQSLGAMVVAGPEGFRRDAYRKFNARDNLGKPGDDYALLREVLTRRFSRLIKENSDRGGDDWPDFLLIDGGAGHLSTARAVLADLGLDELPVAAIAKGPERNAGREHFYMRGKKVFILGERDPVLHYVQRLRDEVHRFVIAGHRKRRAATISRSLLEDIEGVGPTRKRALMLRFGSAQGVTQAGLQDLQNVPGINKALAEKIYRHFHETA